MGARDEALEGISSEGAWCPGSDEVENLAELQECCRVAFEKRHGGRLQMRRILSKPEVQMISRGSTLSISSRMRLIPMVSLDM